MALRALEKALAVLPTAEFSHDGLEAALRAAAGELGVQGWANVRAHPGGRVGRKTAPPLFGTLEVLGRDFASPASNRPSES